MNPGVGRESEPSGVSVLSLHDSIGKLTMEAQRRVANRELAEHIVEAGTEAGGF